MVLTGRLCCVDVVGVIELTICGCSMVLKWFYVCSTPPHYSLYPQTPNHCGHPLTDQKGLSAQVHSYPTHHQPPPSPTTIPPHPQIHRPTYPLPPYINHPIPPPCRMLTPSPYTRPLPYPPFPPHTAPHTHLPTNTLCPPAFTPTLPHSSPPIHPTSFRSPAS